MGNFKNMILILGDLSWENMFASLTAKYLQIDKFFGLQVIRANNSTMKAFNCLSLPTLIKEDGTKLSSLQSISYEFAKTVNLDLVLFGDENSNTRSSVDRHFDIVTKSEQELTKLYQEQLLSRTFMEGNHITIADLLAFCNFYGYMMKWSSEQKFENNCIFRWYNHMQNLAGVKEIWEGDYVPFPQKD